MRLIKLNEEKNFRCGDGAGKLSHGTNCDCERIDKEIERIEEEYASN